MLLFKIVRLDFCFKMERKQLHHSTLITKSSENFFCALDLPRGTYATTMQLTPPEFIALFHTGLQVSLSGLHITGKREG